MKKGMIYAAATALTTFAGAAAAECVTSQNKNGGYMSRVDISSGVTRDQCVRQHFQNVVPGRKTKTEYKCPGPDDYVITNANGQTKYYGLRPSPNRC